MKYRKKPVVIEAIQWDGEENIAEIKRWLGFNLISQELEGIGLEVGHWINTLEGKMKITHGDFIIQGVHGEFYPCKPNIFRQTYELVQED